jgi:hypothetical protein
MQGRGFVEDKLILQATVVPEDVVVTMLGRAPSYP